MAIRCGNCHNEHNTVDEVKACHDTPTVVRSWEELGGERPATDKQRDYLRSLLDSREHGFEDPDAIFTGAVTSKKATSNLIDILSRTTRKAMTQPREGQTIVAGGRTVEDGYYTIVFDEEDDDRITIRLHTNPPDWDFAPGKTVASYLSGPENTSDYTGFAFVDSDSFTLWRRFRHENGGQYDSRLSQALRVLLADPAKAGEAFALESGRCWRCNHVLTVPVSIHRGLGPVCAARLGR